MVSDAEIAALVAKGWEWHAAYRHLQTAAHRAAAEHIDSESPDRVFVFPTKGPVCQSAGSRRVIIPLGPKC